MQVCQLLSSIKLMLYEDAFILNTALPACSIDGKQADWYQMLGPPGTGDMPSVGTAWSIMNAASTPCLTQQHLLLPTAHAAQATAP